MKMLIKQNAKIILFHDEIAFISEIQGWFNTQK